MRSDSSPSPATPFWCAPSPSTTAPSTSRSSAIDTNTIARGGTNITSAIHEAQAALRRRPGSDKILILVTDGEDLEGDALAAAQTAAKADGLKIYTVGVGTPQGDLIPVAKPKRRIRERRLRRLRQIKARRTGVEGHRGSHRRLVRSARSAGPGISRLYTRRAWRPPPNTTSPRAGRKYIPSAINGRSPHR